MFTWGNKMNEAERIRIAIQEWKERAYSDLQEISDLF